ncbi:MAG TPA: hypothetical protein VIL36_03230 [Acidimicrobiales bacterium]
MSVPREVAAVLAQPVVPGEPAQAFPFLTVDDAGAPHCAVVSATEVRVVDDGAELHVALGGRRSRANLEARRRATLLVVEGTTLHTCKLSLLAGREHRGVFAAALRVDDHAGDSLGIPLVPLGFTPPADLPSIERWDVTVAALDALQRDRTPS